MKSYNHLYEQYISDSNIEWSIINSSKGKRKRGVVKRYISDGVVTEYGKERTKKYAAYGSFRNYEHTPMEIYDGITRKKRIIIVPPVSGTDCPSHGCEHTGANLPERHV